MTDPSGATGSAPPAPRTAGGDSPFPAARPFFLLQARDRRLALGGRTLVMGVLNCTPDSFSDGGVWSAPEAAIRRFRQLEEEGADLIDIGGESSRPGSEPVGAEEEWRRVAPVFRAAARSASPVISVDTTKAEVARRAMDHGAGMINDISGLRFDPRLADLARETGAALVVMHMRGRPRTMQEDPVYADVVREVAAFLREALRTAAGRGVSIGSPGGNGPTDAAADRTVRPSRAVPERPTQIVIDPGIGFGKTTAHNLELLRRLPELRSLGQPILVGASRKRFLGELLAAPAEQRLEGSLAAHLAAALGGAHIVRVHDVRATVRALRIADAIRDSRGVPESPSREPDA